MKTVSSKLDGQVKPKPTSFSALPDSDDPRLSISQAGRPAKTSHYSVLPNTGLTTSAGSGLRLDIIITPKHSRTCGKWIFPV